VPVRTGSFFACLSGDSFCKLLKIKSYRFSGKLQHKLKVERGKLKVIGNVAFHFQLSAFNSLMYRVLKSMIIRFRRKTIRFRVKMDVISIQDGRHLESRWTSFRVKMDVISGQDERHLGSRAICPEPKK
jgi:hypothetical protein